MSNILFLVVDNFVPFIFRTFVEMWQLFRDHLYVTFYRRPFYRMMREIIGEHRSARHRRLYALDCVLFLYMHRLLWIAYVIHTDFAPIRSGDIDSALRNDAMLALAYYNRTYDSFCFIGLYLICSFFWFCQTSYWRLNPRSIIWRWWYQTAVLTQDAYRAAKLPSEVIAQRRRQLKLRYWGHSTRQRVLGPKGIYGSIATRVRLWWTLSNVDQKRMFAEKPPMILIPNMTHRSRRSSIMFYVIGDYVALGIQILIASSFIAIAIILALPQNQKFCTRFGLIRIIVEIYAMHYIVQRFIRSGIFCTYCALIANFIFTRKLIKFYDLVRLCIWRHRRQKHVQQCSISNHRIRNVSPMRDQRGHWVYDAVKMRMPFLFRKQCGPTIKMVFAEHNQFSNLVLRSSEELFGTILFAYLLTNLPINVYILQRLVFQPLSPLDSTITSVLFVLQTAAAVVVFWPMGMSSVIFHMPTRFIPALQVCMRSTKWLSCKLKYDDLFGRLVCGPKLGITIGPMDAVTYKTAFESVLLYGAFFLISFKQKFSTDL